MNSLRTIETSLNAVSFKDQTLSMLEGYLRAVGFIKPKEKLMSIEFTDIEQINTVDKLLPTIPVKFTIKGERRVKLNNLG